MTTQSLPAALESLYAAAPSEFTALRLRLVKELKAAGDKVAAGLLAERRRPTQVAYLLNQLTRAHEADVASLVDVGRALERGQRAALRTGQGTDLREAIAQQRKVTAALVKKAHALADALGIAVSLHEVAEAFQAALADPAVASALEAGQLVEAPRPSGIFGGAAFGEGMRTPTTHPPARQDAPSREERVAEPQTSADRGKKAEDRPKAEAATAPPKAPSRHRPNAKAKAKRASIRRDEQRQAAERQEAKRIAAVAAATEREHQKRALAKQKAQAAAVRQAQRAEESRTREEGKRAAQALAALKKQATTARREAARLERLARSATQAARVARAKADALTARASG